MRIDELLMLPPSITYLFLGIFSLAVGSLLNVFIYRIPLMLHAEWRSECCTLLDLPEPPPPHLNLFFPRSFCTSCNTQLSIWQNIPVISYILLRGRCHHCQQSISIQYPLIELLCLGLSLLTAWHFNLSITLLYTLPFVWILICLTCIDIKTQLLPDTLTLSLLWIGLFANVQGLFTTLPDAIYSAAGAYMGLWLFVKLFYLITGKIGMGHGDLKLFAAFGAWFGWSMLPLILILSSITGAVVGSIYLKINQKNSDTPISFGPFLCIAGYVSMLYGENIIFWYLHQVGQFF